MFRIRRAIPSALIAILAACSKPNTPSAAPPAAGSTVGSGPVNPRLEAATFAASLNVDLKASTKSASGLYYRDLVVGSGAEAIGGKQVSVHYDGALADGTHFQAGPISFELGARRVIRGWDEGLVGMKVGGTRQLIIPPDLAYGTDGRPPLIPGNSILIFTVELLAVQ